MSMRALATLGCLAALVLVGCGDSDEVSAPSTATATATATPTPTATATLSPDAAEALWPSPEEALKIDPVEVAKSFAEDFLGVENPVLGEFLEGEPRAGEVQVFRTGEGGAALETVMTTVSLRELDEGLWFVTSAASPDIELEVPEPLAEISSPVDIAGKGRGFEGNIVLEIRRRYAPDGLGSLVKKPTTAGCCEELEPFSESLGFEAKPGDQLALVAQSGSGIDAPAGFTVIPLTRVP